MNNNLKTIMSWVSLGISASVSTCDSHHEISTIFHQNILKGHSRSSIKITSSSHFDTKVIPSLKNYRNPVEVGNLRIENDKIEITKNCFDKKSLVIGVSKRLQNSNRIKYTQNRPKWSEITEKSCKIFYLSWLYLASSSSIGILGNAWSCPLMK